MPRFYCTRPVDGIARIEGEDARHITKSLRMTPGERVTVCDGACHDYLCEIESVGETVVLKVLEQRDSESEPTIDLHLYQALPKGEKMEFIIQKAVELGAASVTPVLTSRCISRPDFKSMEKKLLRFQKIALEAAKQCGRGRIPQVRPLLSFDEMLLEQTRYDISIMFYECGGLPLQKLLMPQYREISLLVGSEGGFSETEAMQAEAGGMKTATLGKRILRCETAPVAGISIIMNLTGNM